MILSLAACGKKSDNDDVAVAKVSEREQDDTESRNRESTEEAPSVGVVADGSVWAGDDGAVFDGAVLQESPTAAESMNPITIYRIGSDKMIIFMLGDMCSGIYENYDSVSVRAEGSGTELNLGQSYVNIYGRDVESYSNYDYNSIHSRKNTYIATVKEPGICDRYAFEGEIVVMKPNNMGEYKDVYNGESENVVKDVSEEEYHKIYADFMKSLPPENVAKADWKGVYVSDGYGSFNGYVEADILDNGRVHIIMNTKDSSREFYLEESFFEEEYFDGEQYILANCNVDEPIKPSTAETFQFHYDARYDDPTVTYCFDDYSENASADHLNTSFYRVDGGAYHHAPEGYVDEDVFGYITKEYPGDSEFFKPATDNYNKRYIYPLCQYDQSGKEIICEATQLTSYDINNYLVANVTRYVFKTDEEAKAAYDYQVKNYGDSEYATSDFVLSGNVYYNITNEKGIKYNRDTFKSCNSLSWYVDCHYAYGYCEDGNVNYLYMSQPITQNEYNVTADSMMRWLDIKNTYYPCKDSEDAKLHISLSTYGADFYLNDYSTDSMRSNFGFMRYLGMTFESISYDTYNNVIFIKEMELSDTEAKITEFTYEGIDFNNVELTLDNYKTKTPDKTLIRVYDLTAPIEENYYY